MKKLSTFLLGFCISLSITAGPVTHRTIKYVKSNIPVTIEVVKDSVVRAQPIYYTDNLDNAVKYIYDGETLTIHGVKTEAYTICPEQFKLKISSPNDVKIYGTEDADVLYTKRKKK